MKVDALISLIEGGIIICVNDMHCPKALISIFVTESGRIISHNELQPSKAEEPIIFKAGGKSIFWSDVHFLKAKSPIFWIIGGRIIWVSDEHPKKEEDCMELKEDGDSKSILFNNEHPENADCSIIFIDEGILTSKSDEHPINTDLSIFEIEDGILILDKDEHSLNELSSIDTTVEGISIWFNELHFWKAPDWIWDKDEGDSNATCFKLEQPMKVYIQIVFINDGISISFNEEQ